MSGDADRYVTDCFNMDISIKLVGSLAYERLSQIARAESAMGIGLAFLAAGAWATGRGALFILAGPWTEPDPRRAAFLPVESI